MDQLQNTQAAVKANMEYFRLEKERFQRQADEAAKLELFYSLKLDNNDWTTLSEYQGGDRKGEVVYNGTTGRFSALGYLNGQISAVQEFDNEHRAEDWCEDWIEDPQDILILAGIPDNK